jgi:hypothetical protein
LTIERSALVVTTAVPVALLSDGSGSGVVDVTVAVFTRVVPVYEAMIEPTIVTVALACGVKVPRLQGSVVQPPWLDEIDEATKAAGNVSLTMTPMAVDGPSLVAVIVQVNGPPATAGPLGTFVRRRSAACMMSVDDVALLFVVIGSVAEDVSVAVLLSTLVPAAWIGSTCAEMTNVLTVPTGNGTGGPSHTTCKPLTVQLPGNADPSVLDADTVMVEAITSAGRSSTM